MGMADERASQPTEPTPAAAPRHGGRDLSAGSVPRHLLNFAGPMLVGSLLQNAYTIVNGVWVGKGLGERELAAVTATFPVFWMLIAAAIGLTMAANILVSQAYGAKDWAQLRRVVGNSVALVGAVCCVLFLVGQLTAEWLLTWMNTPDEIRIDALAYFRIYLWTLPPSFGIFLLASFLRGTGDAMTPLWYQGASVLLACGLDPVLMFGLLGAPRLGLNGTAYASVAAQTVALLALWVHLKRAGHIALPTPRDVRPDGETTLLTLRVGLPSMAQQALLALGAMVLTGVVQTFGVDATAAYGAAARIEMLAIMPAMTFGLAASSISGQNIGAGRLDRVRDVMRWSVGLSAGVTAVVSIAAITVPGLMLSAFLEPSPALTIGIGYLRIVGPGYVLISILFASNGVINGAGHTLATTLATLLSLWACRVPLAIHWSHALGRVEGVWYAIVLSFAVGMVLSLAYYLSGRWKSALGRAPRAAVSTAEPASGPPADIS